MDEITDFKVNHRNMVVDFPACHWLMCIVLLFLLKFYFIEVLIHCVDLYAGILLYGMSFFYIDYSLRKQSCKQNSLFPNVLGNPEFIKEIHTRH